MLRIDNHRLGPRVYVLGARVHEWHLGAGVLLALGLGAAFDKVDPGLASAAAVLLGVWLVAKDWRDLVPSQRDTASWRLGLHGRAAPLRAVRRGDPLPKLAALGTALAGLVNLASAVTPNIGWRDHLLLRFAPFEALRLSHAAAVPASLLLFATAPYLWRKREGALRLAIVLLIGLGVLDVLKGLDFEEAGGSFAGAGVLWLGRRSFCVHHDSVTMRTALLRVPLLAGSGLLLCGFAVWVAAPASASFGAVVHETWAALLWQPGPLDFHDELGALDEAVSLTAVLILASCLWMVFRPLAAPSAFPDIHVRRAVGRLVRRHGSDTLASAASGCAFVMSSVIVVLAYISASQRRQIRTFTSSSTRWPTREAFPQDLHTTITFDRSMNSSCTIRPPFGLFLVGFECRVTRAMPSIITRPFVGSTFTTRPRRPRSLPAITSTSSPFLIETVVLMVTAPRGPGR